MQLEKFSLETLNLLDGGKASLAFEHHVQRAALDCDNRPGDKAARKVTLEVTLKPVTDQNGNLADVQVQIKASSSVPKHQTKLYSMAAGRNGRLLFNPDSTDNVNQGTLIGDAE